MPGQHTSWCRKVQVRIKNKDNKQEEGDGNSADASAEILCKFVVKASRRKEGYKALQELLCCEINDRARRNKNQDTARRRSPRYSRKLAWIKQAKSPMPGQ